LGVGVFWIGQSWADCIVDEGPYEDDYGYAIFPFYNQCDEDFTITLCVKSLPYGSDRAVYNRYSVFSSGRGEVSITNGKWESLLEYRWDADQLVECPFNDENKNFLWEDKMTIEARKMEVVKEQAAEESIHLNMIQKYALLRAHPRRIFLDSAALMWEVYFLWQGNWQVALGIFAVMNTVGLMAVRKTNFGSLAQTTWGKIALLHLNPMNLILQLTGAAMAVYGLLIQDTLTILSSITLILVGHFYGWSKVHTSLKMRGAV